MSEPLDWTLPKDVFQVTLETPHWNTCTHRMDDCVLVKDAEQAAVFWNPRRNVFHYSLQVEGDPGWFSCNVISNKTWERFLTDPQAEMQYIQQRMRELRSLAGM